MVKSNFLKEIRTTFGAGGFVCSLNEKELVEFHQFLERSFQFDDPSKVKKGVYIAGKQCCFSLNYNTLIWIYFAKQNCRQATQWLLGCQQRCPHWWWRTSHSSNWFCVLMATHLWPSNWHYGERKCGGQNQLGMRRKTSAGKWLFVAITTCNEGSI